MALHPCIGSYNWSDGFGVKDMKNGYLKSALLTLPALIILPSCGGGGGGAGQMSTPLPGNPGLSNRAPVFASAATANLAENSLNAFYTLNVSDPDGSALASVSKAAGADAAFFTFDAQTRTLTPAAGMDFELPADADGDNVYHMKFVAQDASGAQTSFSLAVTITNITEGNDFGLNPNVPPGSNFDLLDWKVQLPINSAGGLTGKSIDIGETALAAGYENDYFFTGADGGMVFICPAVGAKTSTNTSYSRTELREMLRRGDTSIKTHTGSLPAPNTDTPNGNNWAFASAPQSAQNTAGGVDGTLSVTMAVNKVTTTGETYQQGRVIIGQIHAKDDEPIRLYYRKLPGNTHGTIYAAHEVSGGDDSYYDIIGGRSSSEPNPPNGIMLNQIFSYEIDVNGNLMDVEIVKDGVVIGSTQIDMSGSGYDVADDYMYFKAGLYHVNNSADPGDDAQVTIYALDNTHDGYPF